jgi:hypothetical protein
MSRNWGIPQRATVKALRPFFPWSLFLTVSIILFALASCGAKAYDPDNLPPMLPSSQDGDKPSASWTDWSCDKLRAYMATHTVEEAQAKAVELHLPQWLVKKAERCPL